MFSSLKPLKLTGRFIYSFALTPPSKRAQHECSTRCRCSCCWTTVSPRWRTCAVALLFSLSDVGSATVFIYLFNNSFGHSACAFDLPCPIQLLSQAEQCHVCLWSCRANLWLTDATNQTDVCRLQRRHFKHALGMNLRSPSETWLPQTSAPGRTCDFAFNLCDYVVVYVCLFTSGAL